MRKSLLALAALLFGSSTFSFAQITFQKTYEGALGEGGNSVQQTHDGGYVITGYTISFGAGNQDVYVIKTDSLGDKLWAKSYGGNNIDNGNSIRQTFDSGYIICGTTNSFGAATGTYDVYLIKTNPNGDTLWTKTFGGAGSDYGNSVLQTKDTGYIIAGTTNSFGVGPYDVYLIKTDANGDVVWTKTLGGTSSEGGYSIQQTTDDGYIITGYTNSFGAGGGNVYLIKTDSIGIPIWTKTFGGAGDEGGYSVKQTFDGGYIITGYENSFGAGLFDIILIKTDSTGNSNWIKTFGGLSSEWGNSVEQSTDGGYVIVGMSFSFGNGDEDACFIKTDSFGNILLEKEFGGGNTDYGNYIQQTRDGGFILTGYSQNQAGGYYHIYLIKTDSAGLSGCNENNIKTIVTTPLALVTSPTAIISSTSTIVTSPSTIIDSGTIAITLCINLDMSEITENNSLLIYPNPSAGTFIISFYGRATKYSIEIINILGEMVFRENNFNESQKEVKLKNVPDGIYFVKVFDGEKYYCKKITVKHD